MTNRPSRDSMLMEMAHVVAKRSTCNRLHVGAVMSRDGRVIATGYNGPVSGMPHCDHQDGTPCDDSVHAEANSIVFSAKYGVAIDGAMLHTTHQPCAYCAKLLINGGIQRVLYQTKYRDPLGILLLERASVECYRYEPKN